MGLAQLALLLFAVATAGGADWIPPPNPDPRKVLDEAREDAAAHRYAQALAKHVWFHHNALKYRPSLYGVRLSFALSAWFDLAQVYPPARTALDKAREEALDRVRRHDRVLQSFNDFESINQTVGEESRTRDEFVLLDARHPDLASMVFKLARPALVRSKEYTLCGKYLRPKEQFASALQFHRMNRAIVADGKIDIGDFDSRSFTNETATLVALLVVNGREKEAQELAAEATRAWDDATFRAAIETALQGNVPEPWP